MSEMIGLRMGELVRTKRRRNYKKKGVVWKD